MGEFFNDFDNVFIDNDAPEFVPGLKPDCPCPPPAPVDPREYNRQPKHINRPYSDKPAAGPFKPEYYAAAGTEAQPNPVPNTYFIPGKKCPPPPPVPKPVPPPPPSRCIVPMEWDENHAYVTKAELNHILRHLSDADIFRDLSENGTTVTVGGIKKGTKFKKLVFSQFIKQLLYPSDSTTDDTDFVCKSADGKVINNYIVKYPQGDLKVGDSLEGMTISEILAAAFCGKNPWGPYEWITQEYTVEASQTMIDAEVYMPELVSDYNENAVYELHVLGTTSTAVSDYVYNEIIARKDTKQVTNVSLAEVPADTKWSYNPESKKITLHTDTEITGEIKVVLIKR